jgi:hypothetical protein
MACAEPSTRCISNCSSATWLMRSQALGASASAPVRRGVCHPLSHKVIGLITCSTKLYGLKLLRVITTVNSGLVESIGAVTWLSCCSKVGIKNFHTLKIIPWSYFLHSLWTKWTHRSEYNGTYKIFQLLNTKTGQKSTKAVVLCCAIKASDYSLISVLSHQQPGVKCFNG